LTLSARIQPTRARSIAPIFPPTSKLPDAMNSALLKTDAGTVSETVSESGCEAVKNCGELEHFLLEIPMKSAIL